MVRLSDLPDYEVTHLMAKQLDPFPTQPWVTGPPLDRRRIAIVSTAGLQRRGDDPFQMRTGDYRVIPGDTDGSDLVMSHASVNFDRTGFQQDINVVFPIDRLRELVAGGTVGSLASLHYSFMGAGVDPQEVEAPARRLARHLKADAVDTVLLVPV